MTVDLPDLRLGVLGFGQRGPLALTAHRPGRGARVVALADPDPDARAHAARCLPGATVLADHRALLRRADIDALLVLTPDHTHADLSCQALRTGRPVFVEKPLEISTNRCDTILRTARETGTRLYVGHNMRHMPVVRLMRALIARGDIGAVKTVWVRHFVAHGGDFYFKDWHAERRCTNGLLLQKGVHDLDVLHWLAGGYTQQVQAFGDLMVYGEQGTRRGPGEARQQDRPADEGRWPPARQRGLNPVIDVEDVSLVNLRLDNGVLAAYQQCHFSPDYWRNYTVIGDAGRLENFGDGPGGVVKVWNARRSGYRADADAVHRVPNPYAYPYPYPYAGAGGADARRDAEAGSGEDGGRKGMEAGSGEDGEDHGGADPLLMDEFLRFAREGGPTDTSPVAARMAVAAADRATASLRDGGTPHEVPPLDPALLTYFERGQT
ncbi:Gfo/Idh/MocA family oxidoreductase [Streptomyces sp. MST-110588]|uniref:Gfo/Idh/MocA family protein n=1 Tax=Streptomyces sp. MST-110588 TaxID=2833628 RepID=UPI001F5D9C1C|nr:Gfo/Idh/MocA family oxidoreductase [Streptomyces sp. MST-110588]UNO43125.1 Gfo/Idh/MocA family oxidoreductase [Streptomyces sp. MST-110588]